ncbi:MAG TPA: DUF4169 domain-containing protein [Alphaproteobacteria bacterium]|jgi:ribosomal protein S2|nr:DUF4169 domain-containing protein [Alphaproteobacteria bacterium]
MTEIINLNKVRKRKAKQEKQEKAAQNRAGNGVNKQAREAARRERKALDRKLEGAKLPSPEADVTGPSEPQAEFPTDTSTPKPR